ncbi:hypothetical protein M514_07097, partial [Trichuris suis]
MSLNSKLPDTSGYSNDSSLIPWKRLDCSKHLRILRGDKSASIRHAINWVYSSGLFPCHTDFYAAAAWAILAHGLVCQYSSVPTSDWVYDLPRDWKISTTEMNERLNRAFLKFPAATDMIVASKANWWYFRCALNRDSPLMSPLHALGIPNDIPDIVNIVGQWASTRKVLSLAGVKGLIEESDVFTQAPQELRIMDELRPYFLSPPETSNIIQLLRSKDTSCLMKYWPHAEEISHVLHELRCFAENGGRYHDESKFLTGKPQESLKLQSFCDKMTTFHRYVTNPGLWMWNKETLKKLGFGEDFVKGFIESRNAGRVKEFLASQTPTVKDDVVEAITKEVSKMKA